ncbi:hypothetical protein [Vandammella animalimorsus]|uniref:Uncharacterized protein n=1 Tax=Vandammella animalimorsus TaxID=2029117 RepID=A0A2A2AXF8_9BURK|nr:hypothetical protein [Vandammella animalimorsus]PAT42394.1 hypothetical protein CK621_09460 [Vandammella animalimorsus]
MNYGADRYCKLFVSGAADDEALSAAVNAALRESAERTAAGADAVPVLDITVHAQVRHLPLDDGQDDFTRWRHYLDIDAAQEDVRFDVYLDALARLVAALRARGWRTVAACDFEAQLETAVQAILAGKGEP